MRPVIVAENISEVWDKVNLVWGNVVAHEKKHRTVSGA
jgi:hypothetical protein